MADQKPRVPDVVELSDAELEAVAGGDNNNNNNNNSPDQVV